VKYKGLIFIVSIFLIFGLFIFWITADSPVEVTVNKIEAAASVSELKNIFASIDAELRQDDEVRKAAKGKISSLKLKKKDFKELLDWFPAKETAINLVIVPDLSKRLKDYPDQSAIDRKIIDTMYSCFLEKVRSKKIDPNSKSYAHDRLITDIADPAQGAGSFQSLADNLMIDLSENRTKATRKYVEENKSNFSSGLSAIYSAASKMTSGTDYYYFLDKKMEQHYQKDDLDVRWQNILVILTDGYLETKGQNYTGSAIASKNPDANRIPPCINADLMNWNIYVLEGRERVLGDNQLLRRTWFNWFEDMNADLEEREFYQPHKDQYNLTAKFIHNSIFGLD
jgi:hypothetical protein